MKTIKLKKICFFSFMFLAITNLHAEPNVSLGKKLTKEERSKLKGSEIKLGDQSFKIITEQKPLSKTAKGTQSSQKTFVANDRGIVGVSQNIVLVSEIPTDQVRSITKNILNSATSVTYYDHLNVTSLQFSNFNQAVATRNELVKIFPDAKIAIPIQFSEKSIR